MRAREFDIKLIDADIEEFKNLLDVFRDVFDWGDHDHPDEEYLLRLLKDDNLLVVVAKFFLVMKWRGPVFMFMTWG